jgi:alkylation response protein AidB-like acyl-CoA dehydrogenase
MARTTATASVSGPTATTSILKNVSSVLTQERSELLVEMLGADGLIGAGDEADGEAAAIIRAWLAGKATTIYAGSYEIQNNIIARRILGLP